MRCDYSLPIVHSKWTVVARFIAAYCSTEGEPMPTLSISDLLSLLTID